MINLAGSINNTNWICDCYYGEGFIMDKNDYCCFACLAINPRFKDEDNKSEVLILQDGKRGI
jgi:hypothetical protein